MRVCLVTENHAGAQMGGAEYQTQLLAEELSRRPGVSVTYLARRVPPVDDAQPSPYTIRRIGSACSHTQFVVFHSNTQPSYLRVYLHV